MIKSIKKFVIGMLLVFVTILCWLGLQLMHLLAVVTKRQELDTQYKILRYKFHHL